MSTPSQRMVKFVAGQEGAWAIQRNDAVVGPAWADARRLTMISSVDLLPASTCTWQLTGLTSHDRYVTRVEKDSLLAHQPALG